MSFDVFLQRFTAGEAADVDLEVVLATFKSFVVEDLSLPVTTLTTADGSADVYGLGTRDGFMINHASGDVIWDALVAVADAADLTILPTGCPVCVTRLERLVDLPPELRGHTRVVGSGADLLGAIKE